MARILLVDDEAEVCEVLGALLRADDHTVILASDGREALAVVATGGVDLVIMDLLMPDMDGIEAILELRRSNPGLRIIAMSGGGRGSAEDYLKIASRCGAARSLTKPFSKKALLDAVNLVLGDPPTESAQSRPPNSEKPEA